LPHERRINVSGRREESVSEYDCSYIKVQLEQLRVPLCCYIEYKGVCALASDATLILEEKKLEDSILLNEWREMVRFLGLNSSCFEFRRIRMREEEFVVAYVRRWGREIYIEKKEKHHNVTFESPMSVGFLKRARESGASTSVESLLRYIKSMRSIENSLTFSYPKEEILVSL
jgi:hypothetical protein